METASFGPCYMYSDGSRRKGREVEPHKQGIERPAQRAFDLALLEVKLLES